jgi:hypothetical protein
LIRMSMPPARRGIASWLPTSLGTPDDDDRQVPGMWLDYGASTGQAGLVVERVNGRKLPNRLQPKQSEFANAPVMLRGHRAAGGRPDG